jgi:hypothetical protein
MGLPAGVVSRVGRGEPLEGVPVADTVVVVVVVAAWAAAAEEEEEGTNSTTAPTSMSARERVIWLVAILLATERTGELFLSV